MQELVLGSVGQTGHVEVIWDMFRLLVSTNCTDWTSNYPQCHSVVKITKIQIEKQHLGSYTLSYIGNITW